MFVLHIERIDAGHSLGRANVLGDSGHRFEELCELSVVNSRVIDANTFSSLDITKRNKIKYYCQD